MVTTFQEEVYWTNGEVWVTDRRVVFIDKHYPLGKFEAVSLAIFTFKQRLHYILISFLLGSTFLVASWLLWRGHLDNTIQSFIDWLFYIAFALLMIGAIAMLLYIGKIPRESLAYIVIRQGFWKRVVFVSTNQAYVEQIINEIRQALGKNRRDTLNKPDKVPYASPYPNYSAPIKVADNPNRVFTDGEWLIAGSDRYRLDAIQVLKTRPISVWLYLWVYLFYTVPAIIQPLSQYLPADMRKSPIMLVIPLLMMCVYIGVLVFMLVTGALDQIAYSVLIKRGSQRIIVYSSMNRPQAEWVREAISQRIGARTVTGFPQPSTTG